MNLRNSFPERSQKEINKIAKKFYFNLTDVIVETIKALTISKKDLVERIEVNGLENLNNYLSNGQSLVVMTSHLCNWEWMLLRTGIDVKTEIDAVYQKLNNNFVDDLMKKIRGRFNTLPISMKALPRELVKRKNLPRVIALVADQTPAPENAYWTFFLNQDTSFYMGPAKIALSLSYPIIYSDIKRLGRGKYILSHHILAEPPYKTGMKPEELIEKYVRLIEKSIQDQPSGWLWSHKRWKHKKSDYIHD